MTFNLWSRCVKDLTHTCTYCSELYSIHLNPSHTITIQKSTYLPIKRRYRIRRGHTLIVLRKTFYNQLFNCYKNSVVTLEKKCSVLRLSNVRQSVWGKARGKVATYFRVQVLTVYSTVCVDDPMACSARPFHHHQHQPPRQHIPGNQSVENFF